MYINITFKEFLEDVTVIDSNNDEHSFIDRRKSTDGGMYTDWVNDTCESYHSEEITTTIKCQELYSKLDRLESLNSIGYNEVRHFGKRQTYTTSLLLAYAYYLSEFKQDYVSFVCHDPSDMTNKNIRYKGEKLNLNSIRFLTPSDFLEKCTHMSLNTVIMDNIIYSLNCSSIMHKLEHFGSGAKIINNVTL